MAQEFALGAWLAQKKLDPEKGTGRGFVTRGGLNGITSYVRQGLKHERIKTVSGDFEADSMCFWDTIADSKAVDPSEGIDTEDMSSRAQDALQTLTEGQRVVLLARAEGDTLQTIADRLAVTKEAVRRTEERAKEKMILALS